MDKFLAFVACFVSAMSFAAPVATIGEIEYETLSEAFAAVPADGTQTTVTILEDIALTKTAALPDTKSVILDLNNHTISGSMSSSSTGVIQSSGSLVIRNGTVAVSGKGIAVKGGAASAKITLESGTITATGANAKAVQMASTGLFQMEGGSITSETEAISASNALIHDGAVSAKSYALSGGGVVTGGELSSSGVAAIYATATLAIEGGTISGADTASAIRIYSGVVTVPSSAILYPSSNKVSFTANASAIVKTDAASVAPTADLALYNGETLIGFASSASTATTIKEMSGTTVKLLKDITTTTGWAIQGNDVTVDLNGHSISSSGLYAIKVKGTSASSARAVTITGEGAVSCDNGGGCVAVYADQFSNVTLAGGTYSVGGDKDNACVYIAASKATAPTTVTITGGSYETGDGKYVLNINDAARTTGGATMSVKGGTFKDFDPANNTVEGEGTSFIEEGIVAVPNEDGVFEVRDYVWVMIPEVEHATASVTIDGAQAEIVDGKIKASVGSKVVVKYAAEDEWANTLTKSYSKIAADTTVDVSAYKPVPAKVKIIAKDGTVSYSATLTTMNAKDGATYQLLGDVTTSALTLGSLGYKNNSITLDLNGHTLKTTSTSAGFKFNSNGSNNTLTVKNGTFISAAEGFAVNKTNTLILEDSLTVKAAKSCVTVIGNGATLETAANLTTTGDTFAIAGNGSAGNGGTSIKVTGGSVTTEGKAPAIYQPQSGTLEISGGTITGASAVYAKCGEISITGGKLVATGEKGDYAFNGSGAVLTGDALVIDNCNYPGGAPTVSVTGGRFESANGEAISSYAGAKAGEMAPAPITGFVSGEEGSYPTFNQPLADELCAKGFRPHDDGIGGYTIETLPAICEVEGVGYWSLQLAVEVAAKSGNPVELLDDVTITERVVVPEGKKVVLDLQGHTLSSTAPTYAFGLKNGSDFELTNGTLAAKDIGVYAFPGSSLTVAEETTVTSETFYGLFVNGATADIKGTVETTAKDGYGVVVWGEEDAPFNVTVSGAVRASGVDAPAIGGNGTDRNPANRLTIVEGAQVSAEKDVAIFWPNEGTLTISGGTITGGTNGIYMKAGSLNVTGGVISSTAAEYEVPTAMVNGSNGKGSAIVIEESAKYGEFGSVSISGGSFTSKGPAVNVFGEGAPQQFITGGSFSNRVPDELCNEGFDATELLPDGSYGVTPKKTVAKIGSREFWSVDRAIEAAEKGEVVELVADYTGPGFVVGDLKEAQFSTAGFTYTATSPISVSGHLVIADESMIDFKPSNPEDTELFALVGFGEKIDISAGSFNVPLRKEWCDDAYEPAELGDGRYGVTEKQHVCKIGDKGYWSVEAALKAAEPFDTIVMIEDVTRDAPAVTLEFGHVTIDLNGHVISSVLVSGAVVTVTDSKLTGYIGGADVEKAVTIEAGKIFFESGKVVAKEKALTIEQSEQGELIEVDVSGGTFVAETVIYQANVHKLPSTALDQITINITDGVFTGNVYAEDKRAFITGGQFDPPPEKKYKRDDIKAEQPSVTVTTELDVVNPYDFKISLREALLYAEQDSHNGISEEGGYKITFNWDAIKADAAARGVEATGVFDLSAAPFEATSELYDDTTGRCKFILIDGTLDHGADGMMGEGDLMAVIRGFDFHTKDTVAPVRAVVVGADPESVIRLVDKLEESGSSSAEATEDKEGEGEGVEITPDADQGEIDDSDEGVCELNGELYTSVRQALAAVPADGKEYTLKLVDDFTGKAFTLEEGQNVVLDLGGHRYEVSNGGFTVKPGATLLLKNGSIRSNTAATLLTNADSLTLENLDLDLSERPAVTTLVKTLAGSLYVTGSTSMTGTLDYVKAERVEFRGTGSYDLEFNAPLTANIRIYSGHFADPDAVPVEFQVVPLDGLYWQIVDEEGNVTKYATLHEAYATIPGDGTPVTITELFDQTDRGLVIDGNKNVTIDFNGKTFTVEGGANHNFIIDGKREVVTLKNGTLRTTAPGTLISNKGHLTLDNMNIDLRACELNPDFKNIISSTYGDLVVTGDTRLAVPSEYATLAVTAQRNDDWSYDKVEVAFDENFTGQVIGQIHYGESTGTTKDVSWLDAARIDVNGGEFDVTLVATTPLVKNAVENFRLHGGTFTRKSAVGSRPIGDFAYTIVDIDWELRLRYAHFERSSFDLIGRDNLMLVDRCSFTGASERKSDWILESDATGRTRLQFLNSVIYQAEGAILVNMSSRDVHERGGFVVIADSTIGESAGEAVIKITADDIDTYLANATFYGNKGKVVETLGTTHAVNVLSQKNGENLPSENVEIMTSIYQEEYADAEIFRMSEEYPTKPHFGPRYLREGTPVDEDTQEGAWSLTSAYHLNDESVAGGNCRYIKLAINNDGYVEAIRTSLKPNGHYTVFAGAEETDSPLHTLHYDQTIANLDRGQPSKGAFWIPVDEPSLVVTTIRDTVNPTDLEISLREAINYAKYLATEDKSTIPTITFDWEALDEELAALRRNGIVGTAAGQLDDFTMYLGYSIDWDRRSNSGDCHLVPGRSASKPISITADELPQGLIINANRSGSVRPYFTVSGALWGAVDVPVAFDLGDETKLKTDHFRVTAVEGTGYQIGKNANLYLTNSSAADSCTNGIVGDEGSTVVLERASVANNSSTGVTATNVSAQNTTIDGGLTATTAQLFNTTVVGGITATMVRGVNDIVSGPVSGASWFRYSAFDSYSAGDAEVTHNIMTDNLELTKAQSSLLWHYRFEPALDWGRLGTAISSATGYDWTTTGAEMPVYIWGQRTVSTGDVQDVETSGVQALPDTWAAYHVGEDAPYTDKPMMGAILNDILTNSRNPHFEQLSMGAWQGRTIVAWKTLAREIKSTDHATDFGRVDLNTYYSTLQEAVEALTINKTSGDKNVQFDGKDAIFLVSATLTNTALGENEQTIIKDGDVAIVGNSYYWSGLKSTSADAAIIVSNDCSVAFSNVGLIDSTGDGVRVYGSGHVSFNRSAVNGNGGDGIRFMDGAHGDLKLVNTTVAKNLGTGVKMQSGTAEIYDSTVAGNGIGLAGAGEFYLANSIVLKNKTANEENVNVVKEAYNVMTHTGLTSEQEDAVFRDSGLSLWYRMLRVNYTGAAGWMGTLLAHDSAGNWFYLDRGDAMKDNVAKENWMWTPVRAGVTQTGALEVITSDQHATSRLLAENAGFHEYAVGAYVPEMELEVEVMNQFTPYNGKAQNPDPNKAIYLIRTGIGKLNQGHELYYNAADKKFYGEFAYVTNRVANAEGVAPAPWGEPTVSNPRTDITDFGFSADIVPIQAGDKINVLRRTVPGAKVEGGFSVDEGGYAYLDGYPFTVTDVSLTKGGRNLTESYTVRYPQTEARDYAMMYITPKSISLSRAFAPTKEYDGTANVIITADSLEHAGILFGEVVISPASKFEYNGADVIDDYEKNIVVNPDGTVTVLANPNTSLKAEDLGFIGSPSVMGNYYITSESQNYTSIVVPKKIRVSLGEIAKKLYDGETTTMTFDFTDDRLIYTATNSVQQETTTLAEALILPTRYLEGQLTVCRNIDDTLDRSQVFPAQVGEYPFYIVADELHVRDTVETTKEFTRNYAFDFTEAQGVFTVEKRPVTLPIDVEDIIYSGEQIVAVDAAISAEPIPTGVKDEAFTVRSLGEANANYETAHVKGNEERQKITIDDSAKVVFEGVNGADAANYKITFAPTGKILKRPLFIKEIKGVQTKLYDGSTVVRVDANDKTSYEYVPAEDESGLLAGEFVRLTGEGRVSNMGVGATLQKVEWNALSLLDDTGKANDYALQPFETDYEDVSVRIEPCDLQLAFSTQRIYDGTLDVTSLALTAMTTNSAGKVTTLKVTQIPAEEGAAWSFKVQTGIVNERTDKEEVVFIDVTSATLTKGEVNTYAGDRRDVLVVAEAKLRAEAETGAVIENYRAFVGERDIATEKDFVGTARINRRPITFQAANRSMTYGGKKPDLTEAGSYKLLNESDLAAGDRVGFLKLAFDTNNIRKSRSGEFQKGYYEKGIVRGDVSIVDENGVTKNRNYTITVRPGALQVGPGTLTMILDATPFVKDYDGTTQAEPNYEAITLKGLIENNLTHEFDDVTVTGVFTYDTKDVHYENDTYANKWVTFVRTAIGGKDAANYDWATDAEGNVIVEVSAFGATINPRPSTVNVSAADKDYDSTCVAQPTTASFSNLVAGEEFDLEMTGVTAAFDDKHRGANKPVVVSLNGELLPRISPTDDKALTANYVFTFDPNTTATIRGIPFAVAAEPKAMTYGDANPDLTVPMETTTAGDTAMIELSYSGELQKSTSGNFTAKTHDEAIELKSIVITDAHGEDVTDSYDIAYTSAALTVAPRTLTVSVEGEGITKVYDGTRAVLKEQENHAISNHITAPLAKNERADEVDVTGSFAYNAKDVLAATTIIFSKLALTGADAANYTLEGVTEVSDTGAIITPLMMTVTIAANDKTYDGNKSATAKSAAFEPLVGSEKFALDLAQISGSFADRHAASGKAVTWVEYSDDLITAVDGKGAIKSNYEFAHNLGATATINPKPATITFAAKNKMYDATTAAERMTDPFVFEGLIAANEDAFAEAFTLDDTSMSYAFSDKNVGEGKTVTASGYNVTFIASSSEGGESVPSDYAFAFTTTAKADITKKPITISYTTLDKVYDANTVATRDAFDYGELIKGDVLTLNDKTMSYAFETKDVGEGHVVTATGFDQKLLEGADVKNYEVSFNVTSSAAITRRPVTITFALVEKTYDGTVLYLDGEEPKLLAPIVANMAEGESLEVRATGEFIDKVHNETAANYFRVDAFAFRIGDAQDLGNYTVTYAGDRVLELPAEAVEYVMPNEAKANSFFTAGRINRKPMTVTANGQEMTYGEAIPEINTVIDGGEDADWREEGSIADDHVAVTLAYSASIPKSTSLNYKAGTHTSAIVKAAIVVTDGEARDVTDSYAITYRAGTLTVAKRDLSMTLEGSDFAKVYDGNTSAKQSNHELVNHVAGDVVDIKGTYNYNSKNVTEAATVTATGLSITGIDAANYQLTETSYTSTEGATITERPTIITVKPANKVYDGTPKTTAQIESFSNLVSGESFNLDKTQLVATFAQSDVGTAVEVTYVGYDPKQVSTGNATTRLDNYSFTFTNTAVGDITKRLSTIMWAAENKEYDALVAATVTPGSFKFGNLVDGESFTMNEAGFTYTFDNKNVGTAKPVTAVPNGTLEAQISPVAAPAKVSNYAFTLTKTALANITPAPLTITFTTKDKTYDATPKATRDAFTYAPLLVDDTGKTDVVTLDDSAMEYAFVDVDEVANTGKNAAENKVVKTVPGKGYDKSYLRGVDKDNYNVTFTDSSTATINKMELRLDLPKADKVYDATTALREGTLVKTLKGAGAETFTATASGEYEDMHVGDSDTYVTVNELTIVGANGAVFGNYVIRYAGHGTESIREQTETGTYANANFNTTEFFGTPGRITKRTTVVTFEANDKHYDQTTEATHVSGSFKFDNLVGGDSFSVTDAHAGQMSYTFADKHVGKDKIVTAEGWTHDFATAGDGTNKDNYDFIFTPTATAELKAIELTISFEANDKVYDATTTATRKGEFTYAGLIDGDAFALDDAEMRYDFDTKNVGVEKTVTATGFDEKYLGGVDVQNYDVHFIATTTATITKKALTLTLSEAVKTYDGTTNLAGAIGQIIPGTEGGEVLTATATGAFVSRNVGSAANYFNVTTLDIVGTNGADFGNYVIAYNGGTIDIAALNTTETTITAPFTTCGTINKKPVTVTASLQTMKFAEARPNLNDGVGDWMHDGFVEDDIPTVTLGWNEAAIAKSMAGHASVGTHAGAIILVSIANDSNYAVTFIPGNLEVIDDPTKTLTIGSKNSHLPITIPSNWLDRNVPTFADWAEANGHALVSDALLESSANGYAKWQNYLLGLDPLDATAKIRIDGVQTSDEDKMRVLYPEVTRPESDYAVHFRLDTTLKGAAKTVSSHYQSAATFDIALGGDDPTGYYSIRCVFTKKDVAPEDVTEANLVKGEGVSSEGIRTVNTFGLLKVDAATTNTVITTPWTALVPETDCDVAVADLLKTATLEEGDMIYVYSLEKGCYESYVLTKEKAFEAVTIVSGEVPIMLPPATEASVARGSGVMLSRKNPTKPLYLIGQVPTTTAMTRISGATSRESPAHHLIGAPTLEDFDLQTVQASSGTIAATTSAKELNDQIFVPTDGPEPIMYTYKNGKWGYDARVATTVAGMTFYTTKRVTDLPKIKAGTGFWYVSRGGNPEIVWPVIGKEVAK